MVLAADEQVEPAVVVVVAPGGRLGRDRLAQAAGDRHVLEDAAALVPQQREPGRLLPGAAQQHDVEVAVVVEVGAGEVQGIDLRSRPAAAERSSNVPSPRLMNSEAPRSASIEVREQVGQVVAVEIVEDAARRPGSGPCTPRPTSGATFSNRPDVELRAERVRAGSGMRGGTFSGYSPSVM